MSRPEDDVPTDADFGIQEGEVDELERRWATRAEEQDENNRLVIQDDFEIEVDGGRVAAAGQVPTRWTGRRRRRRRVTALDRALFNACPVFYGWVVAVLVAASALFISPAQVYCVGAVLDAIQAQLHIDRERISLLYGMSMLMAAPFIMLEGRVVAFVSRRLLAALCGLLFCTGCMLLSSVREAGPRGGASQLGLLLVWTLLQVAGPGMLYPLAASQLQQWWSQKLDRVQMAAESAACVLGMVVMPAIVSAASACPAGTGATVDDPRSSDPYNELYNDRYSSDCLSEGTLAPVRTEHDMQAHLASECWSAVYFRLGAALLVPVLLLALLLLDGGAAELGVGLDASGSVALDEDGAQPPSPHGAAHSAADAEHPSLPLTPTGAAADVPPEMPVRARATSPTARWRLDEVLGHTSFWLAQVSISLVHAVIAAFLFHRHDLLADVHGDADMPMPPETGLHVQLLMGAVAAASTPAGALLRHKEGLVLLALILTAAGLLLLVNHPTHAGLLGATSLLGAAFGVTNAYATKLWEHFYGVADEHRIRYTSIAITTAASGLAVYLFALSREEMCHYRTVMNTCAAAAPGRLPPSVPASRPPRPPRATPSARGAMPQARLALAPYTPTPRAITRRPAPSQPTPRSLSADAPLPLSRRPAPSQPTPRSLSADAPLPITAGAPCSRSPSPGSTCSPSRRPASSRPWCSAHPRGSRCSRAGSTRATSPSRDRCTHAPCLCHAFAMPVPCLRHACAMPSPCLCHAFAMPVPSTPTPRHAGHRHLASSRSISLHLGPGAPAASGGRLAGAAGAASHQ
jgi:hypothetical protein